MNRRGFLKSIFAAGVAPYVAPITGAVRALAAREFLSAAACRAHNEAFRRALLRSNAAWLRRNGASA